MLSRLSILLLIVGLATACRPVLPPSVTSGLAPEDLPLSQRVAGALEGEAGESRFLTRYPALLTAPAPRWLRPGARVTYRVGYATLAEAPDSPPASGGGLIQYDVVAQDRRTVVLLTTLINRQIQGQAPSPLSYLVGLPGVGEIWFAPRVLQNAEAAAGEDFQVTRLPLAVEGVQYNVVRLQSKTARAEEVWAFDVETGRLVFSRQALYRNDGSPISGTTMSLVGQRQVRLPWRRGSVPGWVAPGVEIHLAGTQIWDLGFPPAYPLPMEVRTRITRVTALGSEHVQSVLMSGEAIGQSTGATGVAQLYGGIWLPPEALAVLAAGVVLDRDPLTQVETRVEQADGRQIVLAAAGPGYVTRLTYAGRDGRLTGIYLEEHQVTGTVYTELTSLPE